MSFWTRAMVAAKTAVTAADEGDERAGHGGSRVEPVQPGDHVNAGGDHGRGVDEGAHRRRALHGVRKPDVERDLGRFARRPGEEKEGGERRQPGRQAPACGGGVDAGRTRDRPTATTRRSMPRRKAASPTRLTMKAFLPALAAAGLSNQKPMRR